MEMLGKKTEGFNGAEIEECIKEAMFAAYVEAQDEPKLLSKHLMDAIAKTVPLSTTMKEQIAVLRNWAATRAKMLQANRLLKKRRKCLSFSLVQSWNLKGHLI